MSGDDNVPCWKFVLFYITKLDSNQYIKQNLLLLDHANNITVLLLVSRFGRNISQDNTYISTSDNFFFILYKPHDQWLQMLKYFIITYLQYISKEPGWHNFIKETLGKWPKRTSYICVHFIRAIHVYRLAETNSSFQVMLTTWDTTSFPWSHLNMNKVVKYGYSAFFYSNISGMKK